MPRVSSYVFIDLETTGLPSHELNKTRITELSMVAVRRRHIVDTRPGEAPRVLEKLTLCFNPRRFIHPESSDVSGLDNYLLEYQSPFNINTFNTINCFLQLLEKPVCLVAQNGHSFDFPILKNHFDKLGVSLPDDILCADSLHAFYDILELGRGQNNASEAGPSDCCYKSGSVVTDESSDELSVDQNDNIKTPDKIMNERTTSDKQICNGSCVDYKEYITEELLKDFMENDDLKFQLTMKQQNESTPVQKNGFSRSRSTKNGVRRKLFYVDPAKKPTRSYKLKDTYERVIGRPAIEAHRAENDCIMAMEASVAIGKEFKEWVDSDKNQRKFSEVNAMRLGVPLGD